MLLVCAFPAGVCRSVRTAAPGPAARGHRRGGRPGGLHGRGAGGTGGRTTGPVHPVGCPAAGGSRRADSRPARGPSPRPRQPRPVAARSTARPGTVCLAVRKSLAAAAPFRLADREHLAVITGTHQSGRPYAPGIEQVAQPAPEHPRPVSAPARTPTPAVAPERSGPTAQLARTDQRRHYCIHGQPGRRLPGRSAAGAVPGARRGGSRAGSPRAGGQ
jgi:hypothetical protein